MLRPLYKRISTYLPKETRRKLLCQCKYYNADFDLRSNKCKILFLKTWEKSLIKRKVSRDDSNKFVKSRIDKFITTNKFAKLFDFLEVNYLQSNRYDAEIQKFFTLYGELSRHILNINTITMYFCDLLYESVSSEQRVRKLANEFHGVPGSQFLSSIQEMYETNDELCELVERINPNFDAKTEISNLFKWSTELYATATDRRNSKTLTRTR